MLEELHPIVAQLTPNQEQLPAVLSRGCDVVVTAGAGTGKTRTLVARYLSLLADGMPLRRIIAVTFTRKAAREMRNRVRAEVQRYLNQADLSPEQRDRWQAVYAGLDAARIGTIHSLCTEILRAHPAEAGVDPRFAVLEEGEAAQLRREVVTAALAWAADEPDAVGLFALLRGPDNLRSVVGSLLKQRLDVSAAIETASVDPLAHWQEALEERQAQRLSALLSKRAWSDAVAILRRSTPIDPQDAMAEQRRWALRAIDEATPVRGGAAASHRDAVHTNSIRSIDDRLASLSRLGEISLVGGSYKAWAGGKAEKTAVKDALRTLRRLWRGHADLLSLQINPLDERLAEAMPALRALLLFSVQQYQGEKRDERALDFDDLESRAVELLENHPEVRARWHHEAEAILVDEFQDTNERQRRLVHLLAGDGSTQSASSTRSACPTQSDGSAQSRGNLFIVGDAKQSIYGFRGADVTVFRRERERITGRAGHPGSGQGFALATSYRAHRGLVEALNDLLRPVLGEKDDPHRPWAEPFSPIEPHRATPAPGIEPPYVECHLSVGSKGDGALDRAAQALVARLAQTVEGVSRRPAEQPSNRSLPEGDSATMPPERRPLTYGDVAILCRASTSFSAYEDALDEAGLPYVTVAGRGFYDRPEVRDLLNALRALSDPTDDAALVGLLRSPAIALSDAAVYQLVRAREASSPPGDHVPPLWTVLPHVKADLGPVAEMRVSRAVTLIGRLHTLAGRTGVGDLLKAFLDETHYRAALIRAGQPRAVRNVDKLLDDAQASGLVGVGAFLELVGGLQDSGAREGEARALAGGAVQIMSVHQAKGLEFPIVVLGDATWGSGGSRQDVLVDPELGVLLRLKDPQDDELPAIYRLAQAREDDQAEAEADRLLYVAATRAREKLLVSGYLGGIKNDGTPYKLGGWLGQLGRPLGLDEITISYDENGGLVHRRELQVGETTVDCHIYEPNCAYHRPEPPATKPTDRLVSPLPPPLLAPVLQPQLPAAPAERPLQVPRVVPATDRPKAPAWVVGKLVHEALAAWRIPEDRDDELFGRWLGGRARAIGLVDRRQVAHAVRRTRRLLMQLRAHPLFRELATAQQRLHEVPYSLAAQGRLQTGQMDLLYRRDGTWTLVEFKTDEVRHAADVKGLLRKEDYVIQVQQYAAAAEQLVGPRPRCLLCLLDVERRTELYSVPPTGPVERLGP